MLSFELEKDMMDWIKNFVETLATTSVPVHTVNQYSHNDGWEMQFDVPT